MTPIARFRRVLALVGCCSLAAGLLLSASPSAAAVVRWPWDGTLLLVAFFTLAFSIAALGVPLGVWELQRPTDSASRIPERTPTMPVPGRELERIVDRRWPVSLPADRRRELREQLRETAVRTLVRTTDCDATAAATTVANGTWTDDPAAAAFVRIDPTRDRSRLGLVIDRLRFTRRTRRTVRAVASIPEDGEDDP